MTRDKAIVGLFAVIAAMSAIGFAIMFSYYGRDACLDVSGTGASCPSLAIVNGNRYLISAAPVLATDADLTEYGAITTTNSESLFADLKVYGVSGVSPTSALVARAADPASHGGPYILMFGPDSDAAWPALCPYLTRDRVATQPECAANASSAPS